ncbi:MAG: hypothetical protein ACPGD5_04195 [Salibacteraceae bacterium]
MADNFYSLFSQSSICRKYSAQAKKLHSQLLKEKPLLKYQSGKALVPVYSGGNSWVLQMKSSLEKELSDDLFGAYLHGSLASNEEIAYSDFDALVIIKDAVFKEENRITEVVHKLQKLQKIMHQFDPLQHHGWFVLTESMLQNYPITYFPPILFEHSVSLLKNKGSIINYSWQDNKESLSAPFNQLSNDLIKKLKQPHKVKNVFYLKSLLSEFMLLPALYLQSKTGSSVNKKASFDLARVDFSNPEWKIMDKVSTIRQEWTFEILAIQKMLLSSENYTIRKISRKIAPSIPESISKKLTPEFYGEMSNLVILMKSKTDSK